MLPAQLDHAQAGPQSEPRCGAEILRAPFEFHIEDLANGVPVAFAMFGGFSLLSTVIFTLQGLMVVYACDIVFLPCSFHGLTQQVLEEVRLFIDEILPFGENYGKQFSIMLHGNAYTLLKPRINRCFS